MKSIFSHVSISIYKSDDITNIFENLKHKKDFEKQIILIFLILKIEYIAIFTKKITNSILINKSQSTISRQSKIQNKITIKSNFNIAFKIKLK